MSQPIEILICFTHSCFSATPRVTLPYFTFHGSVSTWVCVNLPLWKSRFWICAASLYAEAAACGRPWLNVLITSFVRERSRISERTIDNQQELRLRRCRSPANGPSRVPCSARGRCVYSARVTPLDRTRCCATVDGCLHVPDWLHRRACAPDSVCVCSPPPLPPTPVRACSIAIRIR